VTTADVKGEAPTKVQPEKRDKWKRSDRKPTGQNRQPKAWNEFGTKMEQIWNEARMSQKEGKFLSQPFFVDQPYVTPAPTTTTGTALMEDDVPPLPSNFVHAISEAIIVIYVYVYEADQGTLTNVQKDLRATFSSCH
jgi:hypothetical protein